MHEVIQGVQGDPTVYLNGQFLPLSKATVSVLDRGFIFGDGIYEVVPVYWGRPFRMKEHLDRLERSLAKIELQQPMPRAQLEQLVFDLLERSDLRDDLSMVYMQVTRGVAKRDHPFPVPAVKPTLFAMVAPFVRPTEAVRTQGLSAISVPDERWLHCDIKSVSLLGNVLAKQAAIRAGVDEVIQFRDGWLTEGSSCNIWVVHDGCVYAPPKNNLVLEGIRYGFLEELCAAQGLSYVLEPISREQVVMADELMLTSATREVLPIVRLDDQPIAQGRPGPVYTRLRQAYDDRILALRRND